MITIELGPVLLEALARTFPSAGGSGLLNLLKLCKFVTGSEVFRREEYGNAT